MQARYAIFLLTLLVMLIGNPMPMWLWPSGDRAQWWQVFTYVLCHGGWLHFAVNMVALLSFGGVMEREWGTARFAAFYLVVSVWAGAFTALLFLDSIPLIGASGTVLAVMGAYVIRFPNRRIATLWPVPVKAWKAMVVFAALSFAALVFEWAPSVAHGTHMIGLGIGVGYGLTRRR